MTISAHLRMVPKVRATPIIQNWGDKKVWNQKTLWHNQARKSVGSIFLKGLRKK